MENKIILGDCLDEMKKMPDKSIDLVLTDPPYGINFKYSSYIDTIENLLDLIKSFMPEVLRIGKRIAIFTGVQNVWLYPKAEWMISYSWNTTATYGFYGYNQWQPIILYGKDIKGFGSINGVMKSDSIVFSGCSGLDKEQYNHPCPKPLTVIKHLINRLSMDGDIVLDPFSGSGTTAIACLELNRRFICIEKDRGYYEMSLKRIAEYKAQLKLF